MSIGVGAAVAATTMSAVATTAVSKGLGELFSSDINPEYKKENLQRMRYIQQKYAMAYGAGVVGEDYDTIIKKLDPQSRLLLEANRPMNPFFSEKAFEDSLLLNYYPVPGHQGRFSASHGLATVAVIIDYQNTRRQRSYIPMVSSPGKPNDYINLFLEESKGWFRNYMSLENLTSEEMHKRSLYYERLKYDNYYWCFPPEGILGDSLSSAESGDTNQGIHHVIHYMHEKVKNAYEVLVLEEKNKSLLSLFQGLNSNCVNSLEFGKSFLGYLLCHSTKLGYNIFNSESSFFSSSSYNTKKAYESGKLHRLLLKVTESLHKDYLFEPSNRNTSKPISNSNNSTEAVVWNKSSGDAISSSITSMGSYIIDVTADEEDAGFNLFSSVSFIIEVCDPKGILWAVRKTFDDFDSFHKTLLDDCSIRSLLGEHMYDRFLFFPDLFVSDSNNNNNSSNSSNNSSNSSSISGGGSGFFRKKVEPEKACELLKSYVHRLLLHLRLLGDKAVSVICSFLEVKSLVQVTDDVLAMSFGSPGQLSSGLQEGAQSLNGTIAESLPNIFVQLKQEFQNQLLLNKSKGSGGGGVNDANKRSEMNKDMLELRKNWGIEMSLLIFDSYSLLQRFSVVISWTLEISHYFISMFGNTFSFSKFPLKNILNLLKEIIKTFLNNSNELFAFACKINADNSYKWHCNLQMAENNLSRIKHHIETSLSLIYTIETEHLNHEAQIKRLNSIIMRLKPFLYRIESNLQSIQKELNFNISLPDAFFFDNSYKDEGVNDRSNSSSSSSSSSSGCSIYNNSNSRPIDYQADGKDGAYWRTSSVVSNNLLLLTNSANPNTGNSNINNNVKGDELGNNSGRLLLGSSNMTISGAKAEDGPSSHKEWGSGIPVDYTQGEKSDQSQVMPL